MPSKPKIDKSWMTQTADEDISANIELADDFIFGGASVKRSQNEIAELKAQIEALQNQIANRPASSDMLAQSGERRVGRFVMTATSISAPEDLTDDEIGLMADLMRDILRASQFWAGDLANIVYKHWRRTETLEELSKHFGIRVDTLRDWAWVCEKIPSPLRNGLLDFSHHRVVAYLPPSLAGREAELLALAAENTYSVRDLRQYIKQLTAKPLSPRKAAEGLFSKERAPKIMELRANFLQARRGDKQALATISAQLQATKKWVEEIEKSLGLK